MYRNNPPEDVCSPCVWGQYRVRAGVIEGGKEKGRLKIRSHNMACGGYQKNVVQRWNCIIWEAAYVYMTRHSTSLSSC
jgi:hypothetical protein